MAIAFDAFTKPGANSNSTTMTVGHTCSGTDRLIVVAAGCNSNSITGVTYNGTAMTKIATTVTNGAASQLSMWYLLNPTSGVNNVVITASASTNIMCEIASYTGVQQSGQPDVSTTGGPTTTTSFTQSITTVTNNDWIIGAWMGRSGATPTAGANTTVRVSIEVLSYGIFMVDSNSAQSPAGSKSMNVTSTSQEFTGITAAFKPAFTAQQTNPSFILNFI